MRMLIIRRNHVQEVRRILALDRQTASLDILRSIATNKKAGTAYFNSNLSILDTRVVGNWVKFHILIRITHMFRLDTK